MRKYLLLITICLGGLATKSQTNEENTSENTPHNGQDPCERIVQIETNPFAPQNTEWYSMRNRFNWMDYVTWHNGDKFAIPYYDKHFLYGFTPSITRTFTNPFLDNNQSYLRHINLKDNTTDLYRDLFNATDFSDYQRLVDEMDITSKEDGWELIWKFDGYEADGITPAAARNLSRGYINTIPCFRILAEQQ
jgi:hypothetical protein